MKKYIQSFMLMLQFLTRIPINRSLPCEETDFKRGTMFFPAVGFVIGGIQWIVFYMLSPYVPLLILSVITVLIGVLITGGLHMDGLGDTFDGFFSFKGKKDKIIEIMKDSRVGTFGALALVFDVLLKVVAVYSLKSPLVIILAPMVSRISSIMLCLIGKRAKEKGSGNFYIENTTLINFLVGLIFVFVVGMKLTGIKQIAILLVSAFCLSLIFNSLCKSKIEGHTGDTLGANNELNEILVLIIGSLSIF